MPPPPTIKLIAIGNEFRQDDGAGLATLQKLQPQLPSGIETVATADATDLIDLWQGVDIAYLFDAVKTQSSPDILYRIDAHIQRLPAEQTNHSTHGFSVAEMVELARALNQLPPHLIVYGIKGHQFNTGHGLSPEVERTVDQLVQQVRLELARGFAQ